MLKVVLALPVFHHHIHFRYIPSALRTNSHQHHRRSRTSRAEGLGCHACCLSFIYLLLNYVQTVLCKMSLAQIFQSLFQTLHQAIDMRCDPVRRARCAAGTARQGRDLTKNGGAWTDLWHRTRWHLVRLETPLSLNQSPFSDITCFIGYSPQGTVAHTE